MRRRKIIRIFKDTSRRQIVYVVRIYGEWPEVEADRYVWALTDRTRWCAWSARPAAGRGLVERRPHARFLVVPVATRLNRLR